VDKIIKMSTSWSTTTGIVERVACSALGCVVGYLAAKASFQLGATADQGARVAVVRSTCADFSTQTDRTDEDEWEDVETDDGSETCEEEGEEEEEDEFHPSNVAHLVVRASCSCYHYYSLNLGRRCECGSTCSAVWCRVF
jgi:hypothetical protein